MKLNIWVKDIIFGVLIGAWQYCSGIFEQQEKFTYLYEYLLTAGNNTFSFNLLSLSTYIYHISPLLVMEIIYGLRIFRHFSTGGIYYISRCVDRKKWFLSETGQLSVHCFLFEAVNIMVPLVSYQLENGKLMPDLSGIAILGYLFCINALSFLSNVFLINILALGFGSTKGGITDICIQIVSCFSLVLIERIAERGELGSHPLLIAYVSLNPTTNSCFALHSGMIIQAGLGNQYGLYWPVNFSVLYWIVINLFLLATGLIIVEKYEFLKIDY